MDIMSRPALTCTPVVIAVLLPGLIFLTGVSSSPHHHLHPDGGGGWAPWAGPTTPRGPTGPTASTHHTSGSGPAHYPGGFGAFDSSVGGADGSDSRFETSNFRHQLADGDPTSGDGASGGSLFRQQLAQVASDAPTGPPPVTEYVINEHQHAVLGCDVPAELLNLVQIFWYHDDAPTETVVLGQLSSTSSDGDNGHRYIRDPTTGSLTITGARMEDDGVWGCQAKEATSRRVLHQGPTVRLVILVPPRPPYLLLDGRRLDPTNLFVPMREHGAVDVECVVEGGNPVPTVTWQMVLVERSLQRLDESVDDLVSTAPVDKPTGLGGHLSSSARIENIMREHHNATVSCLVSHPTLSTPYNASILLDVQYSPSFDITRSPGFGLPVRDGSPLSLKCDVDSNPPSTPVWQKDDKAPPVEQTEDGYLNFTAVRKEHAGWYKCTCRHLLTEYSSNAYLLQIRTADEMPPDAYPASVPDMKHLEATLGGSVQLDCPWGPGSCWLKVGPNGLLQPPQGSGPGSGTNAAVLAIDRVLYQEAGEYLCARDRDNLQRWRNTYSVHMNVSGRPMVHPAVQTVAALAGQSVTLSVEFCANPPARRVVWVTQHLLLRPGTTDPQTGHQFHNITASDTPHCHVATLTLHHVRPDDQGEYLLLVRSPGGASEGAVNLNVTVAEGYSRARPSLGLSVVQVAVVGVAATFLTVLGSDINMCLGLG